MSVRLCVFLVLSILGFSSVCAAQENVVGTTSTMKASWYDSGHVTACGGKFDRNDSATAAHKSLPCGTILKVTNTVNGRYLRMVVRDRGPFVSGRSLDVSYGAAKELGFVDKGVTTLTVEIVHKP